MTHPASKTDPTKCPICDGKIGKNVVMTCARCWVLIPNPERVALGHMYRLGHDASAKLAKCRRIVREKHPEIFG